MCKKGKQYYVMGASIIAQKIWFIHPYLFKNNNYKSILKQNDQWVVINLIKNKSQYYLHPFNLYPLYVKP